MYYDDICVGMAMEIAIDAHNQKGVLVLNNVTEAIGKCKVVEKL